MLENTAKFSSDIELAKIIPTDEKGVSYFAQSNQDGRFTKFLDLSNQIAKTNTITDTDKFSSDTELAKIIPTDEILSAKGVFLFCLAKSRRSIYEVS